MSESPPNPGGEDKEKDHSKDAIEFIAPSPVDEVAARLPANDDAEHELKRQQAIAAAIANEKEKAANEALRLQNEVDAAEEKRRPNSERWNIAAIALGVAATAIDVMAGVNHWPWNIGEGAGVYVPCAAAAVYARQILLGRKTAAPTETFPTDGK